MASCIGNIRSKNYQNLIIVFQLTVENVGDVSFETQRIICGVVDIGVLLKQKTTKPKYMLLHYYGQINK